MLSPNSYLGILGGFRSILYNFRPYNPTEYLRVLSPPSIRTFRWAITHSKRKALQLTDPTPDHSYGLTIWIERGVHKLLSSGGRGSHWNLPTQPPILWSSSLVDGAAHCLCHLAWHSNSLSDLREPPKKFFCPAAWPDRLRLLRGV